MDLSPDAIKEFKEIVERENGVSMTIQEAEEEARLLLEFYRAVVESSSPEADTLDF